MSSKIFLNRIISDHLRSLRNAKTNKISFLDLFTFFLIPLLISFWSYLESAQLSEAAANGMLTAISIFTGLLFNVLVLIYSASQSMPVESAEVSQSDIDDEKKFLEEILANIGYCIVVGVLLIFLQLTLLFLSSYCPKTLLTAVTFLCLSNFTLTLLMALKRIYSLLMYKLNL